VALKEPSRYKGSETHSILKLWRLRQLNGEVVFKFDKYVGLEKEPEEPECESAIFEALRAAGGIPGQDSEKGLDGSSRDEEEEEQEQEDDEDHGARRRRYRAAESSDEEERRSEESEDRESVTQGEREEGINEEVMQQLASKRPKRARKSISSTEDEDSLREDLRTRTGTYKGPRVNRIMSSDDEPQRDLPATTPRTMRLASSQNIDSSPTLAGSSPLTGSPKIAQRFTTQSQSSTPAAPEGSRELRSKTVAAAKEAEAAGIKTRSKGKMKKGGAMANGQKK